ncbi:MAG: hypothetical protein BLM47_04810 [Candidatus Reconcilbacillus cellulovorans]|uniref:Exonuclease domain-containing protein n=1 Tax=Candidatus Reconcilbacillus cellulovorans TaxID=1906605 RepID=A0A2A6E1M3_9BACL|nr:MAG: hypothetical protein BLM47_04810 [Candidatus Reconcilbacillus cellulovorans]
MDAIVYDLEFSSNRSRTGEIIEIGAVRLTRDPASGEWLIADTFSTLVKPRTHLNNDTVQLTGIERTQLADAPTFAEAIDAFRAWVGDRPCYFCTWGPEDRILLIERCQELGLDIGEWFRNHNDLQRQFSERYSRENGTRFRQIGLRKACEIVGVAIEGHEHRALDDARTTARLFLQAQDCFELRTNTPEELSKYETRVIYSSGDADTDETANPFAKLAGLFAPPREH